MPLNVLLVVQLAGAAVTLGLCMFARGDGEAVTEAAAFMLALAGAYLMLLNPRTESSSYVILIPMVALAGGDVLCGAWRRPAAAWTLAVVSICLCCSGWAYQN